MARSKKRCRTRTQALYEAAARNIQQINKRSKKEVDANDESESDCSTDSVTKVTSNPTTLIAVNEKEQQDSIGTTNFINESDLEITIRTLEVLGKSMDTFHSKQCKGLRRAIHPLVLEQMKSYDKGIDYKAKVTGYLSRQQWAKSLTALQGCKDFQQMPKQGTIQRWVRDVDTCPPGMEAVKIQLLTSILNIGSVPNDTPNNSCDAVADKEMTDSDGENKEEDDDDNLNKHDPKAALDALLDAQKKQKYEQQKKQKYEQQQNGENGDPMEGETDMKSQLEILDSWEIPSTASDVVTNDENNVEGIDNTNEDKLDIKIVSEIIYTEEASTRKPPNHYDLLLHATLQPGTISFCKANTLPKVIKTPVPFVKDGFVLQNVLSKRECKQLIQAATNLGYRPDHPTTLPKPTGIDSCEWLIDDSIHSTIYERVKKYLPATMNKKKCHLHSINKRWRFFKYNQNCIYRPHIDGSWPESRMSIKNTDENNKTTYQYEFDETGHTKSYLTFLIYLNDGFKGGETRFYYPSASSVSGGSSDTTHMQARGVIPKVGCVMVFPQGNTASNLHEGSEVMEGAKYVVRTDVLYSVTNTIG